MKTLNVLAAVWAAAALSLPAQATSSATASVTVGSLSLTLVPLAGGPAWINFLPSGYAENYGSANAQFYVGSSSDYQSASFQSDTSPWAAGSVSATTASSNSSAQIDGDGQFTTMSMASSAYAVSPGTVYDCTYFNCSVPTSNANATAQAPYSNTAFVLSPNTIAVFTAQSSVSAEANEGGVYSTLNWDDTVFTNYYGNAANASAYLQVYGPAAGGGGGNQYASDSRSVYVNSYWDGTGWVNASASDSGALGVSFANLTGAEMQGNFFVTNTSWSYAYGNTVPVPEPGTWALMLAGLAVMRAVVRRQGAFAPEARGFNEG